MGLVERMFGIEFRPAPDVPVWHPEVEVYDVVWADGGAPLGRIFLDMHPRPGKYQPRRDVQHAHRQPGPAVRLPECALLCNFPKPGDDPGADAALRRDHVLPRVRPPDPPHHRRPSALVRHLRHRRTSGTSSRRRRNCSRNGPSTRVRSRSSPSTTRPASRCRPRWSRSCGRPTSSARGCRSGSRCTTRR